MNATCRGVNGKDMNTDNPDIGDLVYVKLRIQQSLTEGLADDFGMEAYNTIEEYSDEVTYGYVSAYIEPIHDGEDQWNDTLDERTWAQITILDTNMPADLDMYSFTNGAGDLIIERPLDEWGHSWYMYR